ncbi:MAG: hypothetical protein LBH00_03470 [Planctomycetaceae bacterium]|jgi:hypothetical protein|nr:hypothetical protein [Planctomycetaceae bacterium]
MDKFYTLSMPCLAFSAETAASFYASGTQLSARSTLADCRLAPLAHSFGETPRQTANRIFFL